MRNTKSSFTPISLPPSRSEFNREKSVVRKIAFWISLIVVFMIPWEEMISIGESETTAARLTGLLMAAFWMLAVVVTGEFRKPHPAHVAVYLFVLWNTISYFWSIDVDATVSRIVTYFQLAALVFILWDLYYTPTALKAGLQAYVLGAYIAIGSTVTNFLTGNPLNSYADTYRYSGAGFGANHLALVLALGIPVAWYLAISAGNGKKNYILRLANYAYIPAALFSILLSATRLAMIASVPTFVFILGTFTRLKLSSRALIFAALIFAILVLQPLVPQSSLDRYAQTGTSIAEGDLTGRVEIWRQGIDVFIEHPLLGVGSATFAMVVESGKVAHNTFLSVLAETGIVGFILFAAILIIVAYQAVRQPKREARFWLTILLVWAIGASALTWEHAKPTWLFLGFAVVSIKLSSQRDESSLHSKSSAAPFDLPKYRKLDSTD